MKPIFEKLTSRSCDSYNTAQLQLLAGADRVGQPAQAPDTLQSTANPSSISRSTSRGRSRQSTNFSRRSTNSAPPSESFQSLLQSGAWPNLRGRNAHSVTPGTVPFPQASPVASSSDAEDSMDTGEDWESEMEFWGGESPRSIRTSPILDHEMAVDDGSEEDDDDDSADEDMSDDAEEDETDEFNQMDIFGHR